MRNVDLFYFGVNSIGFSAASKQALAQKDEELKAMWDQMAKMAKVINDMISISFFIFYHKEYITVVLLLNI